MTHPVTDDYRQTARDYRALFGDINKRRGSINGVNFITNDKLGGYKFGGFVIEVSTGMFQALGVRPRAYNRHFGISLRATSTICADCAERIKSLGGLVGEGAPIATLEEVRSKFDETTSAAQQIVVECRQH